MCDGFQRLMCLQPPAKTTGQRPPCASDSKTAKASNETLYRWYGGKKGLFSTMVKDNAAHVKTMLEHAIDSDADALVTLQTIAPILLEMLMDDHAILLNRAAAADHSGESGTVVSQEGRNIISPLIGRLMKELTSQSSQPAVQLGELYLSLLIGDWQTRRVIAFLRCRHGRQSMQGPRRPMLRL